MRFPRAPSGSPARFTVVASLLSVGLLSLGLLWLGSDACAPARPATSQPPASQPPASRASQNAPSAGGDALVMAIGMEPDSLLPFFYRQAMGALVVDQISPALTNAEFADGSVQYVPFLARAIEASPDGRVLTFRLRDDQRWSDGVPVTAEDVIFTFTVLRDPVVNAVRHGQMEFLEAIERPAPDAVAFRFKTAYSRTLQLAHLAHPLVPSHVLASCPRDELGQHPSASAPLAAGAYALKTWKRQSDLVLERRAPPLEQPGRAPVQRILMRLIPDPTAQLQRLLAGEVDLVDGIQIRDVPRIKAVPHLRVVHRGRRAVEYIAWNNKRAPFTDARVRKAMTLAIDRPRLIKDLLSDADGVVYGQEAVSLITPEFKGFGDPGVAPLPFDPAAAGTLLDEAGWKTPAGGGTRARDGKPLAFTLLIAEGSERRRNGAQAIQVWLKQVGVEMAIETLAARQLQNRAQRGEYDAAFVGILAPVFLDQRFAWHSDPQIGAQNLSGYGNPEVDDLVVKAVLESDPERALALHRAMIARVYQDQPVTFLYWLDQLAAIHSRFRDVRANLLSPLHQVESWWVPSGEVKYKK